MSQPTWQDVLDRSMVDPVINAVLKTRCASKEDLLLEMVVELSKARSDLINRWTKEKMTQVVSVIMVKLEEQ